MTLIIPSKKKPISKMSVLYMKIRYFQTGLRVCCGGKPEASIPDR